MKKKQPFLTLLLIGVFTLIAVWSTGCNSTTPPPPPPATEAAGTPSVITFEPLAQGASLAAEIGQPTLFIAESSTDLEPFLKWLDDPDAKAKLETVDFQTHRVIAVFSGITGSTGHGVQIQTIQAATPKGQIVVALTQPGADQNVSEVITYPYHIVQVETKSLPSTQEADWTIVTSDGKTLFSQ
jgi:hypothetical protein